MAAAAKPEEQKVEEEPASSEPVKQALPKEKDLLLDVTPSEEKDIKQKIYFKVYENFL